MRRPHTILPAILMLGALAACGTSDEGDTGARAAADPAGCDDAGVRAVVERFGRALQQVSLLAPDSLLDAALREHYGALVTPALLAEWVNDPSLAPGRLTSSPWPDRIEIDSVAGDGRVCLVSGDVVYVTSADASGSEALREDVTVRVVAGGDWRISAFRQQSNAGGLAAPAAGDSAGGADAGASPDSAARAETTPEHAAAIIRRYYSAIAAGQYERAYRLWGGDGAASGQSLDEFRRGYARTARVEAEVGAPTGVEAAAGSVYVKVPVVVRAVTDRGETQHFEGTYTLRRGNVDGAGAEQRAWRIYDAAISAAPADSAAPAA